MKEIATHYWTDTESSLPPEGELVDTMSPGGQQQWLRRRGALWLLSDGSMYVYYTPKFWRSLKEK